MAVLDDPSAPHVARKRVFTRWEGVAFWAAVVALLVAKGMSLMRYRVDSDEAQHAHVVWAWTQGMVQYRDFFDNHTPVFHMLMSPLLAWLGERGDVMYYLRGAMLPFYFGSLACIYLLVRGAYSRRAALWSTVLIGLWPGFMLTSTEFRTDALWMAAWFATLAVLFGGPLTWRRWGAVGLLLGLTFASSMKTSLLLASLVLAAVPLLLWLGWREGFGFMKGSAKGVLPFILGLLVVPVAVLAYFTAQGALAEMRYCIIEHNVVPGFSRRAYGAFAATLGATALFMWLLCSRSETRRLGVRRALFLGTGGIYLALLWGFWPLVTRQDYLPVAPLILGMLIPPVLGWVERLSAPRWREVARWAVPLGCAAVAMLLVVKEKTVRANEMGHFSQGLAMLLKISGPEDLVMDGKGETIFRHRPIYFVLEGVTNRRIHDGLLKDTIHESCHSKNACVLVYNRMPKRHLRGWISREYVEVARRVWVAGAMLGEAKSQEAQSFEVTHDASYRVVSPEGPVSCVVDGEPRSGEIHLKPGRHSLVYSGSAPLAVVFAKAVNAGLSPFKTAKEVYVIRGSEYR